MKQEIENFSFVEACLHWTHTALVEISFLNRERPAKQIELVNGAPFKFYRISLHYMFIMEYSKLMEGISKRFPQSHYASLERLSLAVYTFKGETFKEKHEQNLKILSEIKKSDFFTKIKFERDKKFAHADIDGNSPLSFYSFTDSEIQEAFTYLSLMKDIIDTCTSVFGYNFVFQHADTRTDNFIKFHTNYKEYYYANYLDAHKKGF